MNICRHEVTVFPYDVLNRLHPFLVKSYIHSKWCYLELVRSSDIETWLANNVALFFIIIHIPTAE